MKIVRKLAASLAAVIILCQTAACSQGSPSAADTAAVTETAAVTLRQRRL